MNINSKLTPADVREIRRLARMGLPRKTIQARYPLVKSALARVIRGETWKEVV